MEIPMARPDIERAEIEAVTAVLRSTQLSMGPQVLAFERALACYVGADHGIAVSSGTAGLHVCIRAARIGSGDLVVTTPFSFVASANVCLYEGAIPLFVDVEEDTGNIDVGAAQAAVEALTHRTKEGLRSVLPPTMARRMERHTGELKAILPVHVFGRPADMDRILAFSERSGLRVIEDACEAIGAEYKGRRVGALGDCGVFAFYPNKQITTGEGGMIVTSDRRLSDMARSLRNQGRSASDSWLEHTRLGFNYRLDEMSSALGRVQLARIDELLAKRDRVADWYNERLAGTSVTTPFPAPVSTRVSWFSYSIRFRDPQQRDSVRDHLANHDIPTRVYFAPIHLQEFYRRRFGYERGDYPNAERWSETVLTLPFSSVMTEAQVDLVCSKVSEGLARSV
jgi:perosamine synthetase